MKKIILFCLSAPLLLANHYFAKEEPYEIRSISANASGMVVFADEDKIGKKLSSKPYIKIDSLLDTQELAYNKKKIEYLKNTIKINEEMLKNLRSSLERKEQNYENIKNLKIKSKIEKDREYADLIASQNLLLSTEKELQNLKVQIADLELRQVQLKQTLHYKNITAKGFVLYELLVRPGQVVNIATPLAKVADLSRAKLTIYLQREDMQNLDKKVVYIDGKKTSYKVSRVADIADSVHLSKYKAQIIIKAPRVFSNLVKVELKDE